MPPFVYIQSQKLINSAMIALEKDVKDVLDIGKNYANKYHIVPGLVFLEECNIGTIIIDSGEKNNFDFIVIGSRRKGKFEIRIIRKCIA